MFKEIEILSIKFLTYLTLYTKFEFSIDLSNYYFNDIIS
jgi:hypothetical protein